MNKDAAQEMTDGLFQIVEGVHKQIYAFKKAGVPEALGLSFRDWASELPKPKLSREERIEAIEDIREFDPDASTRDIGAALGVDAATVSRDMGVANATGEESPIFDNSGFGQREDNDIVANATDEPSPGHTKNLLTENDEWYTPPEWLSMAREVLGEIDLDPASNTIAQDNVKASQFFTIADDSLNRKWLGRVWLNPPYSKGKMDAFVSKLCDEHRCGNVSEAILLTHNSSDTGWFHTAARDSRLVCFTRGRVNFLTPEGRREKGGSTQGQCFFYFGDSGGEFYRVFKEAGLVMERKL